MNTDILKKAMPGLDAYIKDPGNEALFRQAMDMLEEALDEEEKFSQGKPMWHEIEKLDMKPNVTKDAVRKWAEGKQYPQNPAFVAGKIFHLMRRHGVEVPEPTKIRRERQLQELHDERASFGHIMTNPTGQPAAQPMPRESPSVGLAEQMRAVNYHGLLANLIAFTATNATVPVTWTELLAQAAGTLPTQIFHKVLGKLGSLSLGRVDVWIQTARNREAAERFTWPTPNDQLRLIKHLTGFLLRIELETPVQDPTVFSVRLRIAERLFDETDWQTIAARVRGHPYSQGRWNGFTAQYLSGLVTGAIPPPDDPVLLVVMQHEMTFIVQDRFKQGRWP